MKKKVIITTVFTVGFILATSLTSFAGNWVHDDGGWWWNEDVYYPKSVWMTINGKDYYFGSDGYMLHDTYQDGFWLNSEGDRLITEIGLEVAPYKAELDTIIANNLDFYNIYTIGFEQANYQEELEWIDCGDYYKIENIKLVCNYNGSDNCAVLGTLDEIRVRKDGLYRYGNSNNTYGFDILSVDQWINNGYFTPRWSVTFDNKGYVVGFSDGNVS